MKTLSFAYKASILLSMAAAAGCSSSDTGSGGSGGSAGSPAVGGGSPGSGGSGGDTSASGGSPTTGSTGGGDTTTTGTGGSTGNVQFSYTPQWSGVTKVTVIGAFGQSDDWNPDSPFLTLTDDGSGNFTGSADLADAVYPYLFQVIGDDQASADYKRYVIDPKLSAAAVCPAESPTSGHDPNPCSQLTVPQPSPDAVFDVSGVVNYDGAPVGGYLVQLDRDETDQHHFFANRATVDADGKFKLRAAPGTYRLQVLFPTYLSQTDEDRDPLTLEALRRSISSDFTISADTSIASPEMAYHDYTMMSPVNTTTGLPTTFDFTLLPGASKVKFAFYGNKNGGGTIGDPWATGPNGTDVTYSFDGALNTKADTDTVVAGTQYYWGTNQQTKGTHGDVDWMGESMVLKIKWTTITN